MSRKSHYDIKWANRKIKNKSEVLGNNYRWSSLNSLAGIIHLPYNVSTMSLFEEYTGNIPLLFPSVELTSELYNLGFLLSEINWTDKKVDIEGLRLADYYNPEWMPYITYFNNFNELNELVESLDVVDISNNMREFNKIRRSRIYKLWENLISEYFN